MAISYTELKEARKEARNDRESINTFYEIIEKSGLFTPEQLGEIRTRFAQDPNSTQNEFQAAIDSMSKTPEGKARLRDTMSERKAQRLSTKYAPFFQAALAGTDIANSLKQITQSRRAGAQLTKPGLPPVPGADPLLDQQIRDATIGTYDQARAAGPARQELQDTYNKEIALAKSIGGGQASTLGALGQVAALRKNRGAASLLPMLDQIAAREQGRADSLVGQRSALMDQNYRNRFYQYRALQDQYNTDAAAVGGLGAAGRTNLRTSVQNLLGAVPGVAARAGGTSGLGYPDDHSAYEASLNASLTNSQPIPSPYSQLGPTLNGPFINNPMTGGSVRMRYNPTLDF